MRTQGIIGYRSLRFRVEPARVSAGQFLEEARQAGYPIPHNPDTKVNKTLKTYGLARYPSSIPSANLYLGARLQNSGEEYPRFPRFNYGTFAVTNRGEIVFAKLRCGPNNLEKAVINGKLVLAQSGGLYREQQVLQALKISGYTVPAVYGYYPATPSGVDSQPDKAKTLEVLLIESIPPGIGSVLTPEQWTSNLARQAAAKLKTFNKPVCDVPIFRYEAIKQPLAILVWCARLIELDDYKLMLAEVLSAYPDPEEPIVVHGDAWTSNILIRHDIHDLLFIDWELAGPGYKGQDAGRLLWGLTLDKDWKFVGVGENAKAFIDEWCRSIDDKNCLRFGVMYESLHWIAERQDRLRDQKLSRADKHAVLKKINEVKSHALKILSYIPE